MDLRLAGKSALVTGASKGIGLACARAFAAEGCPVHLASRSVDRLNAAAEQIHTDFGVEARPHAVDLRETGSAQALADACSDVEILINNAGDIPAGNIEGVNETRWRYAWDLKVFGFINLTREMLARMRPRGRGVIVNVIGMAGIHHPADYICGAAGNAALDAFTKAVGKESILSGVRVVGVHPPATRTERIIQLNRMIAKQRFGDESRADELMSGVRMMEPAQVADAVLFLASERAGYLSGVVLNLGA